MPDDDLARELVNIAYDPRLANRARLEETTRHVVDVAAAIGFRCWPECC